MKQRARSKRRPLLIALIVGIILMLVLVGVVLARYFYRAEPSNGYVIANEFFFSSNLLDGGTHTLAPGSTSVTFTLGNHPDSLRFSQVDIAYTVKVNGANATGSNVTGSLEKGAIHDQTVTIDNLVPGNTYTVTAEGVGGYHKTLTATIVIPAAEKLLYKYLDTTNSEYVLLTVWAKGCQGNVTITPPAGVLPDNTDPAMASATTGVAFTDSVTFASNGYSSHTYRFFGKDVTVDDFTVVCGTVTAETKAPN